MIGVVEAGKMDVTGGVCAAFDAILAHQPRVSSPLFPQIGFSD